MIKAECTWGDGPDVLLVIKQDTILIKPVKDLDKWTNGTCSDLSTDLTISEAKELADQLIKAAEQAEYLGSIS